jgi:hypothetical protein
MSTPKKPWKPIPRLPNGKMPVLMHIDTDRHPKQAKDIEKQPWGTRTEYVMRRMALADTLSVETERHEELVKGIRKNTDMLCDILQRLSDGSISMQEVKTQINQSVEESQKTLKKLGNPGSV